MRIVVRELLGSKSKDMPLYRRARVQSCHNCTKCILRQNQKRAVIKAKSVTDILKIGTAKTEIGSANFDFGTDTPPCRH